MSELLHKNSLEEIQHSIDNNPRVLIEFGAEWCQPCRKFLPHLSKFAEDTNLAVIKVDVDVDPRVGSKYKIQSVPQVMLFEDGEYIRHVEARTVVALKKDLLSE